MKGTKALGLAVVSGFLIMAAPVGSAQAMSLINPGAAKAVQQDGQLPTTEVRWHGHHHWHHRGHHRWHRHYRWHHRGHWRHHR